VAASLSCGSAGSESAQGRLAVTVVVAPHATVHVHAPQSLAISEKDIRQGYVDAETQIEVTVTSNASHGYTLTLQNRGDQVHEAVVNGLAGPVVVTAEGSFVVRPSPRGGLWTDTLMLRVRFRLSSAARPGVHEWPLVVSLMGV
jgi:hypothetical protein